MPSHTFIEQAAAIQVRRDAQAATDSTPAGKAAIAAKAKRRADSIALANRVLSRGKKPTPTTTLADKPKKTNRQLSEEAAGMTSRKAPTLRR